jgi:hypothetical protein
MSSDLKAGPVQGSVIVARPHWLPSPPTEEQRTSKSKRWSNFVICLLLTTLPFPVLLKSVPDLRNWVLNFSTSWPYVLPIIVAFILVNLYSLLAVFSPRPIVRIKPWEVMPGNQIQIEWEIQGWKAYIKKIQVFLVCTEYYRARGRARHHSRFLTHEPIRIPVTETSNSHEIQQGYAQVPIPGDAIHSLLISKLRITYGLKWEVVFKGDVSIFPDFEDRIEFVVLPIKST